MHDFFPDADLWDYLEGLDVSVLPYRFGTHSGWLEACYDLGTPVLAPTAGSRRAAAVPDLPARRGASTPTVLEAAVLRRRTSSARAGAPIPAPARGADELAAAHRRALPSGARPMSRPLHVALIASPAFRSASRSRAAWRR